MAKAWGAGRRRRGPNIRKTNKPPTLFVVFAGKLPQFFVYTEEIAIGWIGKNELTHYKKYVPARDRKS